MIFKNLLFYSDVVQGDLAQSGVISDADLAAIMDRSHLELGVSGKPCPVPACGVGFEVVQGDDGASVLSNIN